MHTMKALWLILPMVLTACAASSPDYRARTKGASAKQNQLQQWLTADTVAADATQIVAPVCSTEAGHPAEGWAIENDTWCVVACPKGTDAVAGSWSSTDAGLRCYATTQSAPQLITTEFDQRFLSLDSQVMFKGFDRSFVSDTQWECELQGYQIDPDSKQGFWVPLNQPGNTYSFYGDGALMIGRAGLPMKFAGDWRPRKTSGFDSGIVINDQEMFRFAVNYDGSRFDEFSSATTKQVCRFKDHPGPRV